MVPVMSVYPAWHIADARVRHRALGQACDVRAGNEKIKCLHTHTHVALSCGAADCKCSINAQLIVNVKRVPETPIHTHIHPQIMGMCDGLSMVSRRWKEGWSSAVQLLDSRRSVICDCAVIV